MGKFAGIADPEELWERWLTCKWVRSFESGRCSELAFAAGVVEDWQLRMSPADYLEEFRSWPKGVLPGAEALVIEVKSRVPVSCFSNTNVLHWQYAQTWPLMGLFDHVFLSFQMGMLKPDHDAFEHVASALRVPRGRILFLDDNQLHIDAALELRFSASRVAGIEPSAARRLRLERLAIFNQRCGKPPAGFPQRGDRPGRGPGRAKTYPHGTCFFSPSKKATLACELPRSWNLT